MVRRENLLDVGGLGMMDLYWDFRRAWAADRGEENAGLSGDVDWLASGEDFSGLCDGVRNIGLEAGERSILVTALRFRCPQGKPGIP